MRQGPLLSVPGTNNLIVPRGTNISQTEGQDTHFSDMGGDKLPFYTGGKHYFHIVREDKLWKLSKPLNATAPPMRDKGY